jgi:hypothetical protein
MELTMPDVNEVSEPTEVITEPAEKVEGDALPTEGEEPKEGDKKEGEQEETPEQTEAKHKSRNQRRLERARTAQAVAETEARMLREELARERAGKAPAKEPEAPKREDFEDYESYVRADARYAAKLEAQELIKAEREANQGKEKQSQAADADAKVAKQWTERERAFSKENEDYEEVTAAFVEDGLTSLSPGARRLIVESDVGPAVLYHLGNDSALADRIAGMSPLRQIVEIGRLEGKFTAPAKPSSNAPPPINPTKASKSASKDPNKMSIAELNELAKASGSKWAR